MDISCQEQALDEDNVSLVFDPGLAYPFWGEDQLLPKLRTLAKADKTKQWIQSDLSLVASTKSGRCLWKVVVKYFDCLRSFFYGVDLNESVRILEALRTKFISEKLKNSQSITKELIDLFNRSVGNFQAITRREIRVIDVNNLELDEVPSRSTSGYYPTVQSTSVNRSSWTINDFWDRNRRYQQNLAAQSRRSYKAVLPVKTNTCTPFNHMQSKVLALPAYHQVAKPVFRPSWQPKLTYSVGPHSTGFRHTPRTRH